MESLVPSLVLIMYGDLGEDLKTYASVVSL